MKVLIISADNFEDSELLVPMYRMLEEGYEVYIASIEKGIIIGKKGYEVQPDLALHEVDPSAYDVLILPGGKAPAVIRQNTRALEIARHFMETDKPIGAICHGPQILISAGVMKGRHATCYRLVAEELKGAGAVYEDAEVVVDNNLVTSRIPSDLPYFMRAIMQVVKQ
ncbi:MAG: type 1 glutamine amidotransferase [Nitrospira sp.]|nr:type 1 glutamine amidotransferase [bacterium]MBL7049427.1 type 1 glutamine amidotransferase [Nitrospira sp.]